MMMDSALVYTDLCANLYCFAEVPRSATMTMRLTIGPATSDLSPPIGGLGRIVAAYTGVTLADSLSGKALVDTSGLMTVFVGARADATGFTPTDYFTLRGRVTNGLYSGRWTQQIDPHGLSNFGSFATVPPG
jgi:hypothetical protein